MTRSTPPRSAASRGPRTGERDTPLDALVDALYEDRCLPPPQTDHALHVIAALRRRGFVIAGATAAVPLDAGLNDAIWHVIRVMGNDEGCAELAEAARHLVTEYRRIFPQVTARAALPAEGTEERVP